MFEFWYFPGFGRSTLRNDQDSGFELGHILGDDDELVLGQFGNDEYISPEITGTITVNSEGGFFKPQIRQQTADNQTSTISEASLEVIEIG